VVDGPSSTNGPALAAGGPAFGAVRAFDPVTGTRAWEFKLQDAIFASGVLTTASDLLFAGVGGDYYAAYPSPEAAAAGTPRTRQEVDPARLSEGYFYALDARTGEMLWRTSLAGPVSSGVMSYEAAGKQYVAVAAGNNLFAFALRR